LLEKAAHVRRRLSRGMRKMSLNEAYNVRKYEQMKITDERNSLIAIKGDSSLKMRPQD